MKRWRDTEPGGRARPPLYPEVSRTGTEGWCERNHSASSNQSILPGMRTSLKTRLTGPSASTAAIASDASAASTTL
jgi:hypothetical protein